MKILVIDNFDSFVNNVCQYLSEEGRSMFGGDFSLEMVRVDSFDAGSVCSYDGVVVSPGPGVPSDYPELFRAFRVLSDNGNVPVLGICLGLQAMCEFFGGKVFQLDAPRHGAASAIIPEPGVCDRLLDGIGQGSIVGRYHSWAVSVEGSDMIASSFSAEDHVTMSAFHKELPFYGVQFHPESCITQDGRRYIRNFLGLCRHYAQSRG